MNVAGHSIDERDKKVSRTVNDDRGRVTLNRSFRMVENKVDEQIGRLAIFKY